MTDTPAVDWQDILADEDVPGPGWMGIPGMPQPEWARDIEHLVSSAADAARWIGEQPPRVRSAMLMSSVRCAGGKMLLRLYRVPRSSEWVQGRRYFRRTFLAVPTSRATWPDGRPAQPMWIMTMRDAWILRCRCHPHPITVTSADLPGTAPVRGGNIVPTVKV